MKRQKMNRNIIGFIILILGIVLMGCPDLGPDTPELSSEKAITTFSLANPETIGLITDKTIAVTLPSGTDVTA